MFKKEDLKRRLCLKFCPYYKPDKNQELACMGYYVVEDLFKKGNRIIFRKMRRNAREEIKEKLKKEMCIYCPFYESDCDFIQQEGYFSPCGGFILLGILLESNLISFDDIIRSVNKA
ncbi:MAG: hypothetical protein ACPL1G_04800 [Thermodesulfovibrionales bacterium]